MTNSIIRKPEVLKATGLSHSTLYRLIKLGKFPGPLRVGIRCSGWLSSEIDAWISARVDEAKSSRLCTKFPHAPNEVK